MSVFVQLMQLLHKFCACFWDTLYIQLLDLYLGGILNW